MADSNTTCAEVGTPIMDEANAGLLALEVRYSACLRREEAAIDAASELQKAITAEADRIRGNNLKGTREWVKALKAARLAFADRSKVLDAVTDAVSCERQEIFEAVVAVPAATLADFIVKARIASFDGCEPEEDISRSIVNDLLALAGTPDYSAVAHARDLLAGGRDVA
ncbi:MAG: hypothetical protein ACREDP_24400 [Bradyrhizobium sp.]